MTRTLDLTKLPNDDIMLPIGWYKGVITECKHITAARKGTPGYQVKAQITEGEFEGNVAERVYWMSAKALNVSGFGGNWTTTLNRLGVPLIVEQVQLHEVTDKEGNPAEWVTDEVIDVNDMIGLEVMFRVSHTKETAEFASRAEAAEFQPKGYAPKMSVASEIGNTPMGQF